MSKKLNEVAMQSELSGSAFFVQPSKNAPASESGEGIAPRELPSLATSSTTPTNKTVETSVTTSRRRGVTTSPEDAETDQIERLRRAVKQFGKDHSTYRLTFEERQELARIVYVYGERGIKTSFNEITRVGLNWLLEDHRANGDDGILARVLARLND